MLKFTFKNQPFKHQENCLKQFGGQNAYALFAEMGTGKTFIIINELIALFNADLCQNALIVAPNGVHLNWLKEFEKHSILKKNQIVLAAWKSQASTFEKNTIQSLFDQSNLNKLKILAINQEALQTQKGADFALKFLQYSIKNNQQNAIILDEADAFKNPTAIRSKNVLKLKPFAQYRRILTGTPINNSPFDLFMPFSFLNDNILKTKSFFAFKAQYAEFEPENSPLVGALRRKSKGGFIPKIVKKDQNGKPIFKNIDKLHNLIKPHTFFAKKSECIDLPPKIYKNIFFDLTTTQRNAYDKLKKEAIIELENAENPTLLDKLAAFGKLPQITSGFAYNDDSIIEIVPFDKNPKIKILGDFLIRNQSQKIIIWARYQKEIADIAKLCQTINLNAVQYHGQCTAEQRQNAIELFQNKNATIFIGTAAAGGTGITLTAANCVVYYSNTWSLRDRLQSEDRAHRIGQQNNVVYFDLIANNTIDNTIARALQNKEDVLNAIMQLQ